MFLKRTIPTCGVVAAGVSGLPRATSGTAMRSGVGMEVMPSVAVLPNVSGQRRWMLQRVDASTFETEVLQSRQAVCMVYYIPGNGVCETHLDMVQRLTAELNACSNSVWLKSVAIDGDKNVNLASAFSVERSKLPTTFFAMEASIVDKVVGPVPEDRLRSILLKFKEYYQSQTGTDLSLPNAEAATQTVSTSTGRAEGLLGRDGVPTQVLVNKVADSLVGPDSIMLPKETEHLGALKASLQRCKKQAFDELAELHKKLGMDRRRLAEKELETSWFGSSQYRCAAMASALEAVFLGKIYAYIGQLAEKNVTEAWTATANDFRNIMSDNHVKRLMSVVEINVVRGRCRERLGGILPEFTLNAGMGVRSAEDRDSSLLTQPKKETMVLTPLPEDDVDGRTFYENVLRWCDLVDSRTVPARFPAEVDDMFEQLRIHRPLAQREKGQLATDAAEGEIKGEMQLRVSILKNCIVGCLQLFPDDPLSRTARSRLTSMMY